VKHWRITVLAIFIVAAVFTPPEPVSMMLMATPMVRALRAGLCCSRGWAAGATSSLVEEAP
jgi:Sec-independent protein secretion pathway component TatC